MRKIKKKILPVLLSVVMALGLTGCAANYEKTVHTSKTDISFSWWGNDKRHEYTMDGVDIFQEENPDIRVKYTYAEWSGYESRYKVRMNSHTEADVMQINFSWLSKYSPDGEGYYDLYELKNIIDLTSYTDEDLACGVVDGKLNALPIAFNTTTLFYDKNIFDDNNLKVPETWDDFFKASEVLKDKDIYALGMAKKQAFLLLTAYYEQTTGKRVLSDDGKLLIDKAGLTMITEYYESLIDSHVLMPVDQFGLSAFATGKCAGTMIWVSDAGNYCKNLAENGGNPVLGEYPGVAGSRQSGWYIKPATMYAISKNTSNPTEAARLLNFLVNSEKMAELQSTEKGVPVSKKAYEYLEKNDMLSTYETVATEKMNENKAVMNVIIPKLEDDAFLSIFKNYSDQYIYGEIELDECIDSMYADMKENCGK